MNVYQTTQHEMPLKMRHVLFMLLAMSIVFGDAKRSKSYTLSRLRPLGRNNNEVSDSELATIQQNVDKATMGDDPSNGRFFKKFVLFKSLFQKPAESNVIVISQTPAPTLTTPTTTATTLTTPPSTTTTTTTTTTPTTPTTSPVPAPTTSPAPSPSTTTSTTTGRDQGGMTHNGDEGQGTMANETSNLKPYQRPPQHQQKQQLIGKRKRLNKVQQNLIKQQKQKQQQQQQRHQKRQQHKHVRRQPGKKKIKQRHRHIKRRNQVKRQNMKKKNNIINDNNRPFSNNNNINNKINNNINSNSNNNDIYPFDPSIELNSNQRLQQMWEALRLQAASAGVLAPTPVNLARDLSQNLRIKKY